MADMELLCPILQKIIADGYCYDINADLEGMVSLGIAEKIASQVSLSLDQMKEICARCDHYPFKTVH
jgi:hypothetical protein